MLRELTGTLSARGGSGDISPAMPTCHFCYPLSPMGPHGCSCLCQPCADAGGTGVTSSVSTPLFATRGHRSSGHGLTSSSGNPRRSHPGTARPFSPAAHPGFGCPSFFHLWLPPETCLFCCAHVTSPNWCTHEANKPRDRLAVGSSTFATLALSGSALPAELKFQLRWLSAC